MLHRYCSYFSKYSMVLGEQLAMRSRTVFFHSTISFEFMLFASPQIFLYTRPEEFLNPSHQPMDGLNSILSFTAMSSAFLLSISPSTVQCPFLSEPLYKKCLHHILLFLFLSSCTLSNCSRFCSCLA